MRADRFAEGFEVVAALQTGNDPPLTTTVRPLFQSPREVNKILVRQEQLTQRIAEVRIKTRGDDDQIGSEIRRHLVERRFKPALVLDCRRRRTQRKIQRVAESTSSSLLATRTCSGIPRILMRRKEEHRRI